MTASDKALYLASARAKLARLRAAGSLESIDPLERSARQPGSLDLAIKAMCYECQGRDEPSARGEIAACDLWTCPLWPFRPHQGQAPQGHGAAERPAALARLRQARAGSPIRIAAERQDSRRCAINAKCYDCMGGDHYPPETRRLVGQCKAEFPAPPTRDGHRGCPLWPQRPDWKGRDSRADTL